MFLIKRALCVVNNHNQNYISVTQGADTKNRAVSYELKTAPVCGGNMCKQMFIKAQLVHLKAPHKYMEIYYSNRENVI